MKFSNARVKQIRLVLFTSLLIVSFQNCQAPKENKNEDSGSKKTGSSTNASTSGSNQSPNGGINSGSARGATRTPSSSSSSGSITSGSSSSSGAPRTTPGGCIGCNAGSGSGSGFGSGLGGISNPGSIALEITEHPKSATLSEGADFNLGVSVRGGKSPYKYKWYLNDQLLPPLYGNDYYETYPSTLDRIYKEGDYHVVVTDSAGVSRVSNKAYIRMMTKSCDRGQYWFPVTTQKNYSDVYDWLGSMFQYQDVKYFASSSNTMISQLQSRYNRTMQTLGFNYFNLNGSVANGTSFSISCNTDVPTVHEVKCNKDNFARCGYLFGNTDYYIGSIEFKCRNGYLQFIKNTCELKKGEVAPPPTEPRIDDGGGI